MKRSALFVVLALVALLYSGSTFAGAKLASATGQGSLGDRKFSFNGQQLNADGTAKGEANLINPAFSGANPNAPYQLHIDVKCMKVVGNIAIFGGTTKRTNDPNLVDAVFFTVQDNGEPGKTDKISRVAFWDDDPDTTGDPMACRDTGASDFPLEQITAGNVQVK